MERYENGGLVPHPGDCMCQRCLDILRDVLHLSLLGERKPVILPAVPRPHTCTCGAECSGNASPDGSRVVAHGYACRCPQCSSPEPHACTCNAPQSTDWKAHPPGCPQRKVLGGSPEPEPDPVAELRASLGEPLGLDWLTLARLAPYAGPGACPSCHTPLRRTGPPPWEKLCSWCAMRDELKTAAGKRGPDCDHGNRMQCMSCYPAAKTRRGPHRVTVLLVIALALGILSVTLWPEAALGAWTCLVLAAFALPRRQK